MTKAKVCHWLGHLMAKAKVGHLMAKAKVLHCTATLAILCGATATRHLDRLG